MFITHKGKIMKNKRNQKNIIWKILLIIFSIVLIICLIIIGIQKYQQKKQQEYYEALLENESTQTQATEEMPEPETEEAPDILKSLGIEIPEKDIDFAALQEENSDVYAWIYVPGTNGDYPVLQHPEDDTYYLEHNMDGSKGLPGCIYTESVNTKDFTDPNTVLYGHNMKNGTMFSDLKKYLNTDFLNSHRTVRLETADGVFLFTVTEVRRTNTADPWYDRTTCEDGRHLILSTCYGSGKDGRLLIIAEE